MGIASREVIKTNLIYLVAYIGQIAYAILLIACLDDEKLLRLLKDILDEYF